MKTLKELFYEHHMEVGSEVSRVLQKVCVEYIEGILEDCVNVDTLPEVIKQQANAFQQTHCSCEPSVAWLEGFGYCLAGKVHVARFAAAKTLKHCQIENKYKELSNSVRKLRDCAKNYSEEVEEFNSWFKENTPKEGLSKDTTFTKQFVKDAWDNGYSAGYDKANKWHYVKAGDLPKETGLLMSKTLLLATRIIGTKHQFLSLGTYDFSLKEFSCSHIEEHTDVIAWKEVTPPSVFLAEPEVEEDWVVPDKEPL